MVAQCGSVEVHIEFFPDFATAVKALLGQERAKDNWEDHYVTAMGKAEGLNCRDRTAVEKVTTEVLQALTENDK